MVFHTSISFFFVLLAFSTRLVISFMDPEGEIVLPPSKVPDWLDEFKKNLVLQSSSEVLKSNADLIVAKDGSGNYKTVTEAVAAAPDDSKTRFVIYVKRGTYDEVIRIGKRKTNLTIVGDGLDETVLTGHLNAEDGSKTFYSATLGVDGDGFLGQDICIQNTAGPAKGQAVALRLSSDRGVLHRCRIEAYQDILYAYSSRQFYRDCQIRGTIDFICGDARAVFQYCQIEARKPIGGQTNAITAQSRKFTEDITGFSFHKCNITASPDLAPIKEKVKTFLGRPWGKFSRVVFMECFMDDLIAPEGYVPWDRDLGRLSTLYYGEYKNIGPGADTSKRVDWKGFQVISDPKKAAMFTVSRFILGDEWLNSTGVPYDKGL